MEGLPYKVAVTYEKVRHEYPFYVALKRINGRYYLYKAFAARSNDKNKYTVATEYLGRFTEDGKYIKKKPPEKDDLERAKTLIEEHGGRVIWNVKGKLRERLSNEKAPAVDNADLAALMTLSMNARASISLLAAHSGVGRTAVMRRIKRLERQFRIAYTLEIDPAKLGYLPYLILVKFDNLQPSTDALRTLFKNEPNIQFAANLKGEYDLMIYFLEENQVKAADYVWKFRSTTSLSSYKGKWYIMPFGQVYSFVPLRNEFIDKVLGSAHEGEDATKSALVRRALKHRELIVLKELNSYSTRSFSDIDERYNLGKGSARYAYYSLKEHGIIIRPTISITMPMKYVGVILLETINAAEVSKNRFKLHLDDIGYGEIGNKYCLIGNIGSPEGSIYFLPIINEGELEDKEASMEHDITGAVFKTLVISTVLLGSLCYRRFDNAYSRQYDALVTAKKLEPPKLAKYE